MPFGDHPCHPPSTFGPAGDLSTHWHLKECKWGEVCNNERRMSLGIRNNLFVGMLQLGIAEAAAALLRKQMHRHLLKEACVHV